MWRIDSRGPDEIFDVPTENGGGFATGIWEEGERKEPFPGNDNIVDHILGNATWTGGDEVVAERVSRFVSTTEDPLMPYLETKYRDGEAWLYKVRANANTHSVESSLGAIEGTELHSPQAAYLTSGESEWVALDGIPREQIHSAIHLDTFDVYDRDFDSNRFSLREIGLSQDDWLAFAESEAPELVFTARRGGVDLREVTFHRRANPHFAEAGSGAPTRQPYPITEKTQCPTLARSVGCAVRREPRTAEELAEWHRENFPESLGTLEFTTIETHLEGEAGRILSPLPDSSQVLRGVEAGSGAEGLRSLARSLQKSLAADTAVLEKVASHPATVSKALSAAGKVGSAAMELLPYAAIAATGYTLDADITSGRWVDAGFDGAAEGLMIVGSAQPELMVFTEPALLIVLAVQFVVDEFRAANAPAPVMEPWQREQADRDHAFWQNLPEVLAKLRVEATQDQLVAATEHVMREQIIPTLQARLRADLAVLSKLQHTYISEAHRHAVRAAGGIPTGHAFDAVREHRDAAFGTIEAAFAKQRETRRSAYVSALGEQVQATADHFGLEWAAGSAVFEHIRIQFDREVAAPAVDNAEQRMREWSLFQNPPIPYPAADVDDFRVGLKTDQLATYQGRVHATYPDPLTVEMPAGEAEYRRLLAGERPDDVVSHPRVRGSAVPGGVTEVVIHDPMHAVTGVMRLTVPDGLTIVDVQAGGRPAVVNEHGDSVAIGTTGALVEFGGSTAPVRMTIAVEREAPSGTLTGRMSIVDDAKRPSTVLSRAEIAVRVQDTINTVHGFTVPGGTAEVTVPARTEVGQVTTVTAPIGTTFGPSRSPGHIVSPDSKTLTVTPTSAAVDTVSAAVRVPWTARKDTSFHGLITVTVNRTAISTGMLVVSTAQVSWAQTAAPTLAPGETGRVTVRLTNHTDKTGVGLSILFSPPEHAVFESGRIVFVRRDGTSFTRTAGLHEGGRRLILADADLRVGPRDDYLEITATLRANGGGHGTTSGGCGSGSGGCLRVDGGIVASEKKTPLTYTATVHALGAVTTSMGPNQYRKGILVPLPKASVEGVLTLAAPTYGRIGTVYVTRNGSTTLYNNIGRWTDTAVLPRMALGPGTTVTVDLRTENHARPTTTGIGSVTITDAGTTLASGEIRMYRTIEGCITWNYTWVPIPGLIVFTFWSDVLNTCMADIDVRVLYGTGNTSWKTIPPTSNRQFDWWVPYDKPYGIEIGTVRPR